jgi:hypothetical protein
MICCALTLALAGIVAQHYNLLYAATAKFKMCCVLTLALAGIVAQHSINGSSQVSATVHSS